MKRTRCLAQDATEIDHRENINCRSPYLTSAKLAMLFPFVFIFSLLSLFITFVEVTMLSSIFSKEVSKMRPTLDEIEASFSSRVPKWPDSAGNENIYPSVFSSKTANRSTLYVVKISNMHFTMKRSSRHRLESKAWIAPSLPHIQASTPRGRRGHIKVLIKILTCHDRSRNNRAIRRVAAVFKFMYSGLSGK